MLSIWRGGGIALCVWPNSSNKNLDQGVFDKITQKWLPKFADKSDVKLVRGKRLGQEINCYFLIGDIVQGIEILRSGDEFGISGPAADDLLKQLEFARQQKAEIEKEQRKKP